MFPLLFVFVLDFSHLLFYHQLPSDIITPANVKHCHPLKCRCSFKLHHLLPLGITATQCHPPLELCRCSTAQMFPPLELCHCSNIAWASHSPLNVTPTQMPPPQTLLLHKRCPPQCYILGLTQGAFFIFHLLTKPFPSCDQPPIHLDHMTNHLTSHLTTHMTCYMPSSHLLLKCHLPHVTCSQITCASPDIPLPNST